MSLTPAARHRRAFPTWPVLAVAVLAGALLVPGAATPDGAPAGERSLWIEVRDAQGRAAEPAAGALEVEVGGRRSAATLVPGSLERRRTEARIVLYFDQELAAPGTLRRAAEALAAVAPRLADLGEVEVVFADPEPRSALRTRDALAIGELLTRTALVSRSRHRALEVRDRVLQELAQAGPVPDRLAPGDAAATVLAAIEEETEAVAARRDELLAWAAEAREPGSSPGESRPHLLVVVADGWDLDPLPFYARHLDEATLRVAAQGTVDETAGALGVEAASRDAARALSALGWTVTALAPAAPGAAALRVAEAAGTDASGAETGRTRLFSTSPGALFGRRDRAETEPAAPTAELVAPEPSLELFATATGGVVATTDAALRDAVERLAERRELRFAAAIDPAAGLVPLVVDPGPGLSVRAAGHLAAGSPPAVTALRLRALLAGREPEGLGVAAELRSGAPKGELVVQAIRAETVDEDDDGAAAGESAAAARDEPVGAPATAVRLAIAVAAAGETPAIREEVFEATGEEWSRTLAVDLPTAEAAVAVLVEDLASGAWGGTLATIVHAETAAGPVTAQPAVIEVLRPPEAVLRGRVRIEAQALDRRVARVVFLLDDEEVAEAGKAPFTARIDFGRTPRRQELAAVAYDAAGKEIGRHGVVVNGGADSFAVTLEGPPGSRGTGPLEVEAKVTAPPERRIERVLFFWNTEPVATLFAPPFRQRVYVPPERPVGYVRAVALLDDGSVSEDVVFLNGPQAGERVDVRLVELFAVVTDAAGRPVRGLRQEDFVVREDGAEQPIATFSAAGDLPLTIGLAIDSSASMFVKLPSVQDAAARFLRSTMGGEDRVFVVDFDSQPRLARSLTADLDRALRAVDSLEASGRTALWESVVFSLVQLQGVTGRKALVVFSDGADEDDRFPFRSCLQVARRMGVPVYLILMRREPKGLGTGLLWRSFSSRVDRLVEATGGRVFYTRDHRELGTVYDEIESELRAQYLLAYYARPERGDGWRDVDVELRQPGLTPRTLSGYWP